MGMNTNSKISRRKLLKGAGIGAAAVTAYAAAGRSASAQTATPPPAPTITPVPPISQPAGSTKITFWFGLGGQLGNEVRNLVNRYNQSQKKYFVDAVFQASYDDTINKINTALAGGELPHVAQIFDIGQQRMIDTKKIVPVQQLVERDKLQKDVDDLEPAVRSYFTVNNVLQSMPFNNSTAMVYVNKNMLKEAGLNAEKTIWTYNELLDAAKKLVKKDSAGKITRAGFAIHAGSWFMEQQMAVHQQLIIEPENGRKARGTKWAFNNETGAKWLEFLKQFQTDGTGVYFANSAEAQASFVRGEAAMHLDSIAALRGITGSVERSKGPFDVGVIYMPRRDGAKVGRSIIGGASLWVTNTGNREQQEGAWDFIKYTLKPETQALWAASTGYYPVRRASYNLQDMKDALKKYPQFQVAIDQIRSAPADPFNAGGVSGTFVPTRQAIQKAMDEFWTGKASTAKAALDNAAELMNEQLDEYNSTVA
jgi:sn-glycerol 3-phosphate transport system substrate-binding protein